MVFAGSDAVEIQRANVVKTLRHRSIAGSVCGANYGGAMLPSAPNPFSRSHGSLTRQLLGGYCRSGQVQDG
ncbi:hypothetical protein CCHOA_10955 [Corynebacterium choanae]|uniref:Uncharacterized protein n=1 Tax=Corynebacterium choanae TaxID=1862358 RepID=A0A3G6J9I1_9CORY|nr:hypothetical protein CCHOA_10955 [Corynebacterium choanae]